MFLLVLSFIFLVNLTTSSLIAQGLINPFLLSIALGLGIALVCA
jgi:hypothetical protein